MHSGLKSALKKYAGSSRKPTHGIIDALAIKLGALYLKPAETCRALPGTTRPSAKTRKVA
jgi:hypothetical protein